MYIDSILGYKPRLDKKQNEPRRKKESVQMKQKWEWADLEYRP